MIYVLLIALIPLIVVFMRRRQAAKLQRKAEFLNETEFNKTEFNKVIKSLDRKTILKEAIVEARRLEKETIKALNDETEKKTRESREEWKRISDLYFNRIVELRSLEMHGQLSNFKSLSLVENAVVRCGNGHVYHYKGFWFERGMTVRNKQTTTYQTHTTTSTTASQTNIHNLRGGFINSLTPSAVATGEETTTHETVVPVTSSVIETQTEYEFGCPACRTTVYEFDDPGMREIQQGYELHECSRPLLDEADGEWADQGKGYLKKGASCPYCEADSTILTPYQRTQMIKGYDS